MKTFTLTLALLTGATLSFSQISLDTTYTEGANLIKLAISGHKYKQPNFAANELRILNTDHTLYKNITIPTQSHPINKITHVSETLFDTDSDIEYAVYYFVSPPAYGYLYIYDEFGNVEFYKDSVGNALDYNGVKGIENQELVFYDGTNSTMKIINTNGSMSFYTLPGEIPCDECTSGTIAGISKAGNNKSGLEMTVFPNPSGGEISVNYSIPNTENNGFIEVINLSGKIVKSATVDHNSKTITIDLADLDSGNYFIRLRSSKNQHTTEKLIVIN